MKVGVAGILLLFFLVTGVSAQTAEDDLVQAIKLEGTAPAERCLFTVTQAGAQTEVLVERVAPDRTHFVQKTRDRVWEFVIIGDKQYIRYGSSWEIGPLASRPAVIPSMVQFFESSLSHPSERTPVVENGVEKRVYVGTLSWQNGKTRMRGEVEIKLEKSTGLPTDLYFNGLCGRQTCSWTERLEYDPGLRIDPPV